LGGVIPFEFNAVLKIRTIAFKSLKRGSEGQTSSAQEEWNAAGAPFGEAGTKGGVGTFRKGCRHGGGTELLIKKPNWAGMGLRAWSEKRSALNRERWLGATI